MQNGWFWREWKTLTYYQGLENSDGDVLDEIGRGDNMIRLGDSEMVLHQLYGTVVYIKHH